MPYSAAERQARQRQRLTDLLAVLKAENAGLRQDLEAALAEVERLSKLQCRHPATTVDRGTCRACGVLLVG